MPLELFCGALRNIDVNTVKSGMKGRKPDETTVRVESFLWQWKWDLAAANARLSGVLRSCGKVAHSRVASSETSKAHRVAVPCPHTAGLSSLAFGILFLIQI